VTNRIKAEDTVTIDQLQAAFASSYGAVIGQLTIRNLSFEKQVQQLQIEIEQLQIEIGQQADKIFWFEQKDAQLIEQNINFQDRIKELETTITELVEAGPTYDQIAAQAKAIIDEAQVVK